MEVYRAVKAGNVEAIEREMDRLRRFSDAMMHALDSGLIGLSGGGPNDLHLGALTHGFPGTNKKAARDFLREIVLAAVAADLRGDVLEDHSGLVAL